MNIHVAVFADFVENAWGDASRLDRMLGSRRVIDHTLRRAAAIAGVQRKLLVVRTRDREAGEQALLRADATPGFELLAVDSGERPRRELLSAGRKWNVDAWRGGLTGATWFDEFVEPLAVAHVFNAGNADAVLCLDGHQAALDPNIAMEMIDRARREPAAARFVFTQAPPGIAGVLMTRECVRELVENRWPVGILLTYRPEMPVGDPITRAPCVPIAAEVAQTRARLSADQLRSADLLSLAFSARGEDADAASVCAALREAAATRAGDLPVEVEIELTTDDPLPETTLRPRGGRAGHRHLEDLSALSCVLKELAGYDDRLVFLGGHGDPLAHPRVADVLRNIRAAGVFGLGLATPLLDLPDEAFAALFEQRVDVVEVLLDSHTPQTYRRVNGVDGFERARANVQRLLDARRDRKRPRPLVVCRITRCAATLAEIEPFFDAWTSGAAGAVIAGYDDYCGLLEPDGLIASAPLVRGPCRRLASRLLLLADGNVPWCSQDARGQTSLGDWTRESLRDIWSSAARRELLADHAEMALDGRPLCVRCSAWHRP